LKIQVTVSLALLELILELDLKHALLAHPDLTLRFLVLLFVNLALLDIMHMKRKVLNVLNALKVPLLK